MPQIRTSAPGQADTLYEYDELGNQTRTGLDVDGSSFLEPASADRITESDAMYTRIGAAWWQQSVQTVYAETGDDTATPQAPGAPGSPGLASPENTGF